MVFGKPGYPYYQSGTGTPAGDTVGKVLDYGCIDEGFQVTDSEAFETARFMARTTGLLVGGSTGGVIYKALESIDAGTIGGNVLVIVAEGGEKYLHTFYDDQWMAHRKLFDPAIEERLGRWLSQRVKAAAFVEA